MENIDKWSKSEEVQDFASTMEFLLMQMDSLQKRTEWLSNELRYAVQKMKDIGIKYEGFDYTD